MKYYLAFIGCLLAFPLYASEESSGMFFSFLPEWLDMGLSLVAIILVPVAVIVLFVGMWRKVFGLIWYVISLQPLRRYFLRKKLAEKLEFFRDIPAQGDLNVANMVMNAVSSSWISDYSGLFGALILRLIDNGALKMEFLSNRYGAEPHWVLSVQKWPGTNNLIEKGRYWEEVDLEREFFLLMEGAAGGDAIIEPRELQHYLRQHDENNFLNRLNTLSEDQKKMVEDPQVAAQILGLKHFLVEASLIRERGIAEMTLWKEYLVYATLFGVADKVCDNFSEVYSDFFKTNVLAATQLNVVGNNGLAAYVSATMKGLKTDASNQKSQI